MIHRSVAEWGVIRGIQNAANAVEGFQRRTNSQYVVVAQICVEEFLVELPSVKETEEKKERGRSTVRKSTKLFCLVSGLRKHRDKIRQNDVPRLK